MPRTFLKKSTMRRDNRTHGEKQSDELTLRGGIKASSTVLVCAFNKPIAVEFEEKLRRGIGLVREWSPQQTEIHTWFKKAKSGDNLVVVARAGTGKSTTILGALDFIPGRPKIEVKTLHALGFSYLRENWPKAKIDDRNEVEWDRIDEAVDKVGGREMTLDERKLLKKFVGRAKGTVAELSEPALRDVLGAMDEAAAVQNGAVDLLVALCARVLKASLVPDYESRISFDDMLFVPVFNGWVKPRYDRVVVDEAQDMNAIQLRLAQGACRKNGNLAFVGDDMQAIYGFRGADSGCLARLQSETDAKQLGLTITYRCPKSVVALAQTLVPDFTAHESAPDGVVRDLPFEKLSEDVQPGDAILSRINAPLVGVCLDLLTRDMRAVIKGKDIGEGLMAIVKKVGKADSINAFLEALGIWRNDRVERIIAADKGSKKRKDDELSEAGEKKIEELTDRVNCIQAIAESVNTIEAMRAKLDALFVDRPDAARVITCSSVHKAKGLEWPRVFVLEDSFNYVGRRKGPDGAPLPPSPEENNIRYVAITRAKEELVQVRGRRVK